MNQQRKPRWYAAVLLGTSVVAVGALAAPAMAARTPGPPSARSHIPGLRIAPNPSALPALGRRPLAATKSKELFGVFCNTPKDCWAVGEFLGDHRSTNQVLHWTGGRWNPVKVANPAGTGSGDLNELFAVRCTSARNCWAVGDSQHSGGALLDQIQHFNGTKWSVTAASAPGGTSPGDLNSLEDVACTSIKSCWAVGDYGLQSGIEPQVLFNQTLHFDGQKWTFVKTPNPAGHSTSDINALFSVRCTGPDDCWAVGTGGNIITTTTAIKFRLHNAMLHWNGKKWAALTVPSPVGPRKSFLNELNTLACTAPNDCWAVGIAVKIAKSPKGFEHNQALHWNGKKWALVTTPNPGGPVNDLIGVTCTAPDNCWAVGGAGQGPGLNLALRWNGKSWSVVHTPNGGAGKNAINTLSSVRCTSTSNCWAVGDASLGGNVDIDQMLRWNGTKWLLG